MDTRDEDVVALTHVCRGWREVFVSRPTLWTNLKCVDEDKTHVYLERSKSFPISLSLHSVYMAPPDSFFEFIPGISGRLKSLNVNLDSEDLQFISPYLSRPAPLLEVLWMRSEYNPELESTLFDGGLPSLRELRLEHVRTKLPWRNMINLTSFTLDSDSVSVCQLLDFFEGAPHLRRVEIHSTSPKRSGARDGRLVPLPHLQWMDTRNYSSSRLFDHLLIPVGAQLHMEVDLLLSHRLEGCPPRFIDNLKNLSGFTAIGFYSGTWCIEFSGPNGEVLMDTPEIGTTLLLEFLTYFDTSKTKRFEILGRRGSLTGDHVHRTLLPMKDLHTIKFDQDNAAQTLHALHPGMSSSGVMVCPKLDELIIVRWQGFDIEKVAATVAARASRGAKLKSVKIVSWDGTVYSQPDVLELTKHVPHAECDH